MNLSKSHRHYILYLASNLEILDSVLNRQLGVGVVVVWAVMSIFRICA